MSWVVSLFVLAVAALGWVESDTVLAWIGLDWLDLVGSVMLVFLLLSVTDKILQRPAIARWIERLRGVGAEKH